MANDPHASRLAELRAQLSQLVPRLNDQSLSDADRAGVLAAMVPIYEAIEALGAEVEEG